MVLLRKKSFKIEKKINKKSFFMLFSIFLW